MTKYGTHIIHNTDCPLIKKYNKYIVQKIKGANLSDTIAAQQEHKKVCESLLFQIRVKHNI